MRTRHFSTLYFVRSLLAGAAVIALGACGSGNADALRKRADIESQEAAGNDVKYQNQAIETRAKAMEADLLRRQRFFQALAGTFEGSYEQENTKFTIGLSLSPNLYPYSSDRVRLPEEVSYDLTNLAFNVQVRQWVQDVDRSASGCRFEQVRPDLGSGQLQILGKECNNAFFITVAEPVEGWAVMSAQDAFANMLAGPATVLTQKLLGGDQQQVTAVVGLIRPTLSNREIYFKAERVNK